MNEDVFSPPRPGAGIIVAAARAPVWGYAAGRDRTRRALPAAAKPAPGPWDKAAGFDHSAPIGTIVPADRSGHPVTTIV